jgi:hypothetical protein
VIVVAVVVGALALSGGPNSSSTSSAQLARSRAEAAVVALWSYNYKTFDADLRAGVPFATPSFGRNYSAVADDLIKPDAVKRHRVVMLTVQSSVVQSVSTQRCVVLVTMTATTRTGDGISTVATVVARTTMDYLDGRWLVDNLESA